MDTNGLIKKLETKINDLREKLVKRRLDMVDQDNSNVSRYITATRWAVEQEIEAMDKELSRLESGIKEVKKLIGDQKRWSGKYFVSDSFEYVEFGIISKETKMGKEILESSPRDLSGQVDSCRKNKN